MNMQKIKSFYFITLLLLPLHSFSKYIPLENHYYDLLIQMTMEKRNSILLLIYNR